MRISKDLNKMSDPRTSIIDERLRKIKRIIAVSSGKGGVGKSIIATALALTLSRRGFKVGLFDLDFTSPSTHIILNAQKIPPKERRGIIPPKVHGLEYMSLVYFVGDNPAPLRGVDTSNVLIELLTITQWGRLDFLIIDMPPGIGDAVLDLIRLVKRIEFFIVTTPSLLAFETVKKQVTLLCELKIPIVGVIENMKTDQVEIIQQEVQTLGLRYLGGIPFDEKIERAIGYEAKLLQTDVYRKILQIGNSIFVKREIKS